MPVTTPRPRIASPVVGSRANNRNMASPKVAVRVATTPPKLRYPRVNWVMAMMAPPHPGKAPSAAAAEALQPDAELHVESPFGGKNQEQGTGDEDGDREVRLTDRFQDDRPPIGDQKADRHQGPQRRGAVQRPNADPRGPRADALRALYQCSHGRTPWIG